MAIKAVANQESEIIGYTLFCGDDIIRIVADNLVEVGYLLNWNHRIVQGGRSIRYGEFLRGVLDAEGGVLWHCPSYAPWLASARKTSKIRWILLTHNTAPCLPIWRKHWAFLRKIRRNLGKSI